MILKEYTTEKGNFDTSLINFGLALNILVYAKSELLYDPIDYTNGEYRYEAVTKVYQYILDHERDIDYSIFQDKNKLNKIIKELFDLEDIE